MLLYTLLSYLAYVIFGIGAHENHLLAAGIPNRVPAHLNPKYRQLFLIGSLAANINLFIFYGIDGRNLPFSRLVWGFDTSILLAVVYVASTSASLSR